jgi:tRNA (uracil-5-)-methyltransferase TRM9
MQEKDPRKIINKVRKDYNLIAREWDLSRSRPSQLKIKLISFAAAGSEVLDIGCGNGVLFPFFSEKSAFYSGVDIAENLIDIARERYAAEIEGGRAKFITAEATELPFKDSAFDFVVSFAVLHHIPSDLLRRKFFDEIRRVLRPDGKVKITVWNLFNGWAKDRFDIGLQLARQKSGDVTIPWKGTRGVIVNRYVHQFSFDELYALAEASGFFDIKVDYRSRSGESALNAEEIVLEMRG